MVAVLRSSWMDEPKYVRKTGRAIRWSIGTAIALIVGAGAYGWFGPPGLNGARSASPAQRPVPVTAGKVAVEKSNL
jgi:hypothetical protein